MNWNKEYGLVTRDSVKKDTDKYGFGFIPYKPLSEQEEKIPNDEESYQSPSEKTMENNEQEGFWSDVFRTASQVPQGLVDMSKYGIATDLWQMMAHGEVFDPEEIEHLKMISEREGIPFNEESYLKAAESALGGIPTVSNIASKVEEKTGIPLEPKTPIQRALRFFTGLAKVSPTGKFLTKKTKPSGMIERGYEKLKEPTRISEGKISKINQKVEDEFRLIANDIIEKSPANETFANLKRDKNFKKSISEGFGKVEELANEIPGKINTKEIRNKLLDISKENKKPGISPSEYEKTYNKFVKEFVKDTPITEASQFDLVKQYRKNNSAYGEIREPSQSSAYNRAKMDALKDYNKAISETIQSSHPGSEYSKLFNHTNEQWSKIMDAESISGMIDELFEGKIHFEKGKKILEREGRQKPLKRLMGKEGYKKFETLIEDLISTEDANKMMKVAQKKGLEDIAKTGLTYVLHPNLAMGKGVLGMTKGAYRRMWEFLLDKPQLAVKWDKGIKAFKEGDFRYADSLFNEVKRESSE